MTNVYYWFQNRSELETLRQDFQISTCNGFFVPYNFFNNEKTREAIKDAFQILGKDIFLYKNYAAEFRPVLLPDKNLRKYMRNDKNKEIWRRRFERKREALEKLNRLVENPDEALDYVNEQYSYYTDIKKYLNQEKQTRGIEFFLQSLTEKKLEVKEFEFPFVPIPPYVDAIKHKDLKHIYDLSLKLNEIFFQIKIKHNKFKNCIFNITASIKDIENKSKLYKEMIKKSEFFPNIALWIIDFNELYVTKRQIERVNELIKEISLLKSFFIFKFAGIYSNRLLRILGEDLNTLIRLNGYPGNNINVTAPVQRTRKLIDPINADFLNLSRIGDKFENSYNCSCKLCMKYGINDYETAREFYLRDDPENSRFYSHLVGRAILTKRQKIRRIQNQNILKHCFHNLELSLRLDLDEFCSKFSNEKNIDIWKELYSVGY